MELLKVYAKKVPTTDDVILKYDPKQAKTKKDTVIFHDKGMCRPFCRITWWSKQPTRAQKTIILNCFRWQLVWIN